jgi:putative transposase
MNILYKKKDTFLQGRGEFRTYQKNYKINKGVFTNILNILSMLNKKAHKSYKLLYHLILITKYRKEVFLNDDIIYKTKDKIIEISKDFNINILEQGIDLNHIHILFESEPTLEITKYINILKGHSSRYIRKEFQEFLKDKLWGDSFWSDSYYIATTGNVSLSSLKKYIEEQESE